MEKIIIKTPEQIDNIREAGKYRKELMIGVRERSKAGVTLMELENYADAYIRKNGVTGAFKGFEGFPANLCLSVNECVVHGIPDDYVLKNGDLLKIDTGITYKENICDACTALIVGGDHNNPKGADLIETTKLALDRGVETLHLGGNLEAYGKIVYKTMNDAGYSIFRYLTGHGVGVSVHEGPSIHNYPHRSHRKVTLRPGMVVACEPITAERSEDYVMRPGNDRNLYTEHGDLSAQREYTLTITDNGPEILAGMTEI